MGVDTDNVDDDGGGDGRDEGGDESGGSDSAGSDVPVAPEFDGCRPGPGVLRRLTAHEFRLTLQDLFQSPAVPEGDPLDGSVVDGYPTNAAGLMIQDLSGQALSDYAEKVAKWAVETNPAVITRCSEHTETCWQQTVRDFGRRAFRAPIGDDIVDRYVGLFALGNDFSDGLELVVAAMIQSPFFMYRRELGQGDEFSTLSDHEVASSLAFLLTGKAPDAELSALADQGMLSDELVWEAQVDRLLDTPEAEARMVEFVAEWLGLDDLFARAKNEGDVELTDTLRQSMWSESDLFIRSVFQAGTFPELFNSASTFVNPELAAFYDLTAPLTEEFEPTSLVGTTRTPGLLGQASYLVSHSATDSSSPTLRGIFVRERLLCLETPPPPASVDTNLPDLSEVQTVRERFSKHVEDPSCAGCHNLIDPIGFGFENYDGNGQYRDNENGIPVDASGVLVGLESGEEPFNGLGELSALLADSPQVRRCFAKNFAEFSFGQGAWESDECSIDEFANQAFEQGDTLKSYVKALLTLPHFRYRIAQGAGQ